MKTMKSYRMKEIDLDAIKRIKEITKLETDTKVISYAIWWLEMSIRCDHKPSPIIKDEYLLDK